MNKKTLLITIAFLLSAWSFSQTYDFDHEIGVSLKASTNGIGGDIYYRPAKELAVKAGIEYLSLNLSSDRIESFIGEDVNVSIPNPYGDNIIFNTDAKFKTGALSLAVGYQPFKMFYLTAGIGKSLFASDVSGLPANNIELGSYDVPNVGTFTPKIAKDKIGPFNIDVNSKNSIIPYIGIGLGSFVPQNKAFSFALELGAYYVGNYSLKYSLPSGLNASSIDYGLPVTEEQKDQYFGDINNEVNKIVTDLDNEVSIIIDDINDTLKSFKFYPVLKLTVGFRAFTFKK